MDLKIDGKLNSSATDALEDHVKALYNKPGARRVGIIELRRDYNTAPDPSGSKKAVVGLAISGLEIATVDQEDDIRRAMRALHLHRTARGTLDEAGQLELSQDTVRLLGEMFLDRESIRLAAGVRYWAKEMDRVINSATFADANRIGELRHEVDRIHTGLEALLHPARVTDDDK